MAPLAILGGAASLVTRFRQARGVERQQLRWLAMTATSWASVIGTVFLPLATGAAILRYRLFDLDRIISRTLSSLWLRSTR